MDISTILLPAIIIFLLVCTAAKHDPDGFRKRKTQRVFLIRSDYEYNN